MKKTLLALSLALGYVGMQAESLVNPEITTCMRNSGFMKTLEECRAEVAAKRTQSPRIGLNTKPANSPTAADLSKALSSLSYYNE